MPSANYEDLMRIETALSEALAGLIKAKAIPNVFTRKNYCNVELPSERIEIAFNLGEATGHEHTIDGPASLVRYDRWRGQFTVQIITPSLDAVNQEKATDKHDDWRAIVRNIMEELPNLLTVANCPYHEVGESKAVGTTPSLRSSDGIEACTLVYAIYCGIRADAWPAYP
jgi:hypothetical protein